MRRLRPVRAGHSGLDHLRTSRERGWSNELAVNEPLSSKGGGNRGKKLPPQFLTPDELQAVLEANNKGLTGTRNRALIVVGWRSGVRIGEALSIRPTDLDETNHAIRVLHGKGNKARTVGMDRQSWAVISNWMTARKAAGLDAAETLFCTETGGRLDSRYVRELLPRLAAHANVNKRCHFHGLRHTMAFELVTEGVPVHLIQQQLGHSNVAITSRYINHLNPAETINRMKARSWNKAGTPSQVGLNLNLPDWLERFKSELGNRLIAFTDLRTDESQFRVLLTLL